MKHDYMTKSTVLGTKEGKDRNDDSGKQCIAGGV